MAVEQFDVPVRRFGRKIPELMRSSLVHHHLYGSRSACIAWARRLRNRECASKLPEKNGKTLAGFKLRDLDPSINKCSLVKCPRAAVLGESGAESTLARRRVVVPLLDYMQSACRHTSSRPFPRALVKLERRACVGSSFGHY